MKIVISWSKAKSKELALKTKALLESIDPQIEAFVSEVDIFGGQDVQEKIIEKIRECEKLVLCFTMENKKAPWLLFEAGYARGLGKNVIPMLFDDDPNWHSWVDNPMNVARNINVNNRDFAAVFIKSFEIDDTSANKKKIELFRQSILDVKENFRDVDVQCEDLVGKLIHNDTFVVENPFFRERTAHFLTGFESFDLYKTILDSFLYTGKYLWIYGRKNMKLFGGSFKNFFKYLKDKSYEGDFGLGGIDFRCLFLDPNSEETKRAHPQQNIFQSELNTTILRAKDEIGDNARLKKCFRFYSNRREEVIIRVDNSIVFSRPNFDVYGQPQLLTNSGFEVFSASSDRGKECIKKFQEVWDSSNEML